MCFVKHIRERCSRDNRFNFQVIDKTGLPGKFRLKKQSSFWKLYARHIATLSGENVFPLIFRPDKHNPTPFYMDLDFRADENFQLTEKTFFDVTHELLIILNSVIPCKKEWKIVITRRTGAYYKGNLKKYCGGFHIIIPNLICKKDDVVRFRKAALQETGWYDKLDGYGITNDCGDILDNAVLTRGNGLILVGFNKKQEPGNGSCSPHYIYGVNMWNCGWKTNVTNTFGWEFRSVENRHKWMLLMKELYGWVFKHNYTKPEPEPEPKVEKKVGKIEEKIVEKMEEKMEEKTDEKTEDITFDLEYFLLCVARYDIGHSAWKQVVIFCRIQGLEKQFVLDTLNVYFRKMNYDPKENERVWNSYNGKKGVTEGSIVFILQKGKVAFDRSKLFPGRKYRYHNEADIFYENTVWDMFDVEAFFQSVYSYIWGNGSTKIIYEERYLKTFGTQTYTNTSTVISDMMPFSLPKTDILILVKPTYSHLKNTLESIKRKKVTAGFDEHKKKEDAIKCLLDIHGMKESEAYNIMEVVLGTDIPDPVEMSLGKLLQKTKQRGKLTSKFHSYTLVPYLDKNPVCSDCLNLFAGFSMQRFRNTNVDVKKTTIWEWLYVCWANRSDYKMHYLLSFFALKLQYPARKVNKYFVSYCRETGVGKTSVLAFIRAVFDEDKVLFCRDLVQFLGEQNAEFLNKLFVVIDDIERANRKQSDQLKSTITGDTMRYKKLYSDPVQMPCFFDLVCTSNERSPVFISDQNRRVELVMINPEKKKNDEFWKKYYTELQNHEICGAWFEFLATYKPLNVRLEEHRFDIEVLNCAKIKNMKSSHAFVLKFFSHITCFANFRCWNIDVDFSRTSSDSSRVCYIKKKRIYDFYTQWCRDSGIKCISKKDNFLDDLHEINIQQVRHRFYDRTQPYAFKFANYLKKNIADFYSVDERIIVLDWFFIDERFEIFNNNSDGRVF